MIRRIIFILIIVLLILLLLWYCGGSGSGQQPQDVPPSGDLAVVKLDLTALDQADALANIATPVSRDFLAAVTPTDLGVASDWTVGDAVEIVGFGISGGSQVDDPLKRRADVVLTDCAPGTAGDLICFTFSNDAGPATCGGDSGGPMLATVGTQRKLIGVASSSAAFCSAGEAQFVDVTRPEYRAWIESKMTGSTASAFVLVSKDLQGELTAVGGHRRTDG